MRNFYSIASPFGICDVKITKTNVANAFVLYSVWLSHSERERAIESEFE